MQIPDRSAEASIPLSHVPIKNSLTNMPVEPHTPKLTTNDCLPLGQIPSIQSGGGMPLQSGITQQGANERNTTPLLIPAPPLACSRYNRQLLLPQIRLRGQEYLSSSKVLIIGLGGLGSPAALYLAGAGVDTLGFLDSDSVEVSNLHRQIVHTEAAARLGRSKVHSAASRCKELNSEPEYVCHEEHASPGNILNIVSQYDLVLDCTDNPATRYLISDACVLLGKLLVSGAAQRGEGMLVVLNRPPLSSRAEEKGPCYRCVFPRPPAPETVRGCSEIGILGPVVGTIGTLMAGEAIKIISSGGHLTPMSQQTQFQDMPASIGSRHKTQHTMLLYNSYATDPRSMFRTFTLRGRRKDCLVCGDAEDLANKGLSPITADVISQGHLDYQAFCGVEGDVRILCEENRVSAGEFLQRHAQEHRQHSLSKRKRKHVVFDVREEHEFELGSKVRDSVNIPLSKILRHGGDAFEELETENEATQHGEMPDEETHIPKTRHVGIAPLGLNQSASHGGNNDRGSHIPVMRQTTFSSTGFPTVPSKEESASSVDDRPEPGERMIDHESHIPVDRQTILSDTNFPARPDPTRQQEEGIDDEQEPLSVYFVCQRGNDSQIAAQKLIDSIKTREVATHVRGKKRIWGWVGDVRGGFLAMEKLAITQ